VLEHDGQPLSGATVSLVEMEETQLFPALAGSGTPPAASGPPVLPRMLAAAR
jgi:hypothetical protein